jgi:cytochrome c-type biogenesis protein CcmH
MGWVFAFIFAVACFAALWKFGRMTRTAWELTLAALLIGLAGYAWQGSPSLPETKAQSSLP